jgi:hypothetical protein
MFPVVYPFKDKQRVLSPPKEILTIANDSVADFLGPSTFLLLSDLIRACVTDDMFIEWRGMEEKKILGEWLKEGYARRRRQENSVSGEDPGHRIKRTKSLQGTRLSEPVRQALKQITDILEQHPVELPHREDGLFPLTEQVWHYVHDKVESGCAVLCYVFCARILFVAYSIHVLFFTIACVLGIAD